MEKEPLTINGLEKLKEELIFLKEQKRPEIVAAIAEARSHGDLKENAEYHAAKEQQSHNEGRIEEINDIIARANVIDITKIKNDGKVIFGSTVFLENLDTKEKIDYKIVGKDGYSFPLIIQHLDDQILDFYTRPPSYLLHDFFHRDLISQYGLQNEYNLVNGSGYYVWRTDDVSIYYQGECTITCFPVFYSQVAAKNKLPPTYKSLGKIFEDNLTLFE